MKPPIVELRGISRSFGKVAALEGIDLDVQDGELLTLLGPSGCGKTTLMRLVAGFDQPTTGEIRINGRDMKSTPPERRPVNMVFQRYALFPHLDVFDNIAFGLRLRRLPKEEISKRVHDILELVQLPDYGDRWINQLSGGQSQRVALARALVNRPSVLLLDEPLAALDLKIRQHMVTELKRIHRETGTTFIYVTHDQDEAMMLSDRIVLMNKGRIEQIGSPEEMYGSPRNLFCAQFLGDTNLVPCAFEGNDAGRAHFKTPFGIIKARVAGGKAAEATTLSIRPEAFTIGLNGSAAAADNVIRGKVVSLIFVGNRIVYDVTVPGDVMLRCQERRVAGAAHAQQGDEVTLSWSEAAVTALSG